LEDRDVWDNIKIDLEEIGFEVTTGFEYRSEQGYSVCVRRHSHKPLDFIGEGISKYNRITDNYRSIYCPL
jgi:hypothetical protein